MFKKAKEISDDKVNIAVHTYELVDKHIRKLDSDLAKFESEMKVGFLSLHYLQRLQGLPLVKVSANFMQMSIQNNALIRQILLIFNQHFFSHLILIF